jgi:hypothetical protein
MTTVAGRRQNNDVADPIERSAVDASAVASTAPGGDTVVGELSTRKCCHPHRWHQAARNTIHVTDIARSGSRYVCRGKAAYGLGVDTHKRTRRNVGTMAN